MLSSTGGYVDYGVAASPPPNVLLTVATGAFSSTGSFIFFRQEYSSTVELSGAGGSIFWTGVQ